ncbi:Oidioi.mRNA.OKI2018_I69.chr1.g3313.t1.cds [Oikopleura dioica]|uniref:B9 domain-containing protein 1 n=1 Tax=Oikopleura dioica TaxID=34765 RepID=A0ABN7STS0_OIKDI|nr:Oidioi.mRNA.OKI2018_I69.chr1.g3313.t1.cds [Oikopleura dioica]
MLRGMDLMCKYSYEMGSDWVVAAGLEEGFSQRCTSGNEEFVFNLPMDCTFKSTNPSGWPRIVIELIGQDNFNQDQPRGFCWALVPPIPGSRKIRTAIYLPQASSKMQALSHWFTGNAVNFTDPKIIARPNGREMTRVQSVGYVTIQFDVTASGLSKFGYDFGKDS